MLRGPSRSDGLKNSEILIRRLGGLQGLRTAVTAYEHRRKTKNKRWEKASGRSLEKGGVVLHLKCNKGK